MQIDLNREEYLFNLSIEFQLTNGPNALKNATLVFRIIQGTRNTASLNQAEKLLHFEITDDTDSYFLYVLDVGEQDFHNLKREQSLLVDFTVFPAKMIELLELCRKDSSALSQSVSQDGLVAAPSSFIAKLDTITGLLSVVETNMFKQLTHISLQMRQGNDAAVKSYLASRLQHSLSLNHRLSMELKEKSEECFDLSSKIREVTESLCSERSGRDVERESWRASTAHECSELKMQAHRTQDALREKFEHQIVALRSEFETALEMARRRGDELERTLNDTQEERLQGEQRAKELNKQLIVTLGEVTRLESALQTETLSREDLQTRLRKIQGHSDDLESRTATLERGLVNKEEENLRLAARLRDSEQAVSATSAQLTQLSASAVAFQEQLRGAAAEIERGNHAMSLLQEQAKRLREKVQLKSEVIRRQEALVNELRQRGQEAELRAAMLDGVAKAAAQKESAALSDLESVRERLKKAETLISSNEKMIDWLNQEVTRLQLEGPWTASNAVTPPSNVTPQARTNASAVPRTAHSDAPDSGKTFRSPDTVTSLFEADHSSRAKFQLSGAKTGGLPVYDWQRPEFELDYLPQHTLRR